jgi:hypothetical protein
VDLLKQTDSIVIEQYTEVMAAKNATARTHDGMSTTGSLPMLTRFGLRCNVLSLTQM